MDIYNELPTAFPWYDKKEKQQRFRENARKLIDYDLISPHRSFLPFQIRIGGFVAKPLKWELVSLGDGITLDISKNIGLLKAVQTVEDTYVYYGGQPIDFRPAPEVSPLAGMRPGKYFTVLTFDGGVTYFSEVFKAVKDLRPYIKFEFWNSTDISPLLYKATGWRQTMYLDTFIHVNEPEVEVDGERDIRDTIIPTFSKMTVKSRFSVVVPDFIKIALVSAQMHDGILITADRGLRIGDVDNLTTSTTVESGGAYSTVDVLLEKVVMTKTSCPEEVEIVTADLWATINVQRMYGKNVAILGDSMSDPTRADANAKQIYWGILKTKYAWNTDVDAVSGTAIAPSNYTGFKANHFSADTRIEGFKNRGFVPDIILIFGGTNDFGRQASTLNIQLGTNDDPESNTYGDSSFYAALKYLYHHLQINYPGAKIFHMEPLQRSDFGFPITQGGKLLTDFVEAIDTVAAAYGVTALHTYAESGLTYNNMLAGGQYSTDGLHPKATGHSVLAKYVERELLELY